MQKDVIPERRQTRERDARGKNSFLESSEARTGRGECGLARSLGSVQRVNRPIRTALLSLCPVTTSFLLYAAERQGLVTTRVFVRPFSFSPSQTTLAARRRSQVMPPKSESRPKLCTVLMRAKEELREREDGSTAAFSLVLSSSVRPQRTPC